MTISSETIKVVALGDGSTTVFNYDFLIPSTSDIEVIYTNTDGDSTTLAANDYTITGVNNPDGGTVTYLLSGSPIASGTTLTIARSLEYVQTTTLQNQGAFYPAAVDQALDYITMLTQQLAELFSRAIVAPITDPDPLLPLPSVVQRALQLLGFDADGNPIAAEPSSALVSTVMQPVVAAATLALARTALGLGNIVTNNVGGGLQSSGGSLRVDFPFNLISVDTTLTSANHMTQIGASGPVNLTLPLTTTLFNGFGFWVYAFGGAVTLVINGSDNFKAQASGASIAVPQHLAAWVSTDAAGIWYIRASPSRNSLPIQSMQGGESASRLRIHNNSGTPNTKIDVLCDEAVLAIPGGQVRLTDFSTTIDATTNGLNGLDTGSLAASTWYFVWIIAEITLTASIESAAILSLSATAPTLPAGWSYAYRVGAVRTDGSVHFYRTKQRGESASYTVGVNPAVPRVMVTGIQGDVATPTWFAVSVSNFVPSTAAEITVTLHSGGDGGANGLAPNNLYDPVKLSPMNAVNAASTETTQTSDIPLESTNIYYVSDHTNSWVECLGWIDNL